MQPWKCYPLQTESMPTGWTRVEYQDNPNLDPCRLMADIGIEIIEYPVASHVKKWWLSQQACVHKHLQDVIVTYEPLHFITNIHFHCILDQQLDGFTLRGTFMMDAPSTEVYLFLFNPQFEVLDGQLTIINPPDAEKCYWAFDPAGLNQLTQEIAEDIGLPTPKFTARPYGPCLWEEETISLIRDFHAARGFDPESQDAAIAAGYPLIDIEAMKRSAQELTGKCSMEDEDIDGIYYSLALC
ncbi:hypothetical protein B0H14DRAFT_353070 [Mycena olivaceomarginata]|nr:hypothetical protein B0H14DRAFT_353070 [Mycena olivaceomarginata]